MKPLQNNDPESPNALSSGGSKLGSRELRASLSRSLRRANAGERIVITDGGVPVAQLGPLDSPGQSTMDELVARGLVVPPRRAQPLTTTRVVESPIEVWSGVRLEQVVRDLR
jgi:prevent-host-death family protein